MSDNMVSVFTDSLVENITDILSRQYFDFGEGGEDAEWVAAEELAEIIVKGLNENWYFTPKDVIDYPEEEDE